MSTDNDIEVRVTAKVVDLQRGMDKAAKSVEDGAQRMDGSLKTAGDSMSGVASVIQSRLAMVAGIVAAAFASIGLKSAADDAAKLTESSIDLGRAMGVSATEASVWIAVLDDIGASQGELSAASRGLTTKLRENEEALNRMGLKTRDANGNLRPMNDLMLDAITVVNSFKEGTDRNAAAQEMFGRSITGSSKLLQASREKAEETRKKMEELGIVVGKEDVEAWDRYDTATDDANLIMKAVQTTIGQALIPVLSALKEKLVSIGPDLVKIARVAMETFLGVIDLVRLVKQAVNSVGSDIGATAAAAAMALRGDFTGAMNVFKARAADAIRETQRLKDLWNGTGDSFLGKFRQPKTDADKSNEGQKDFKAPPGASGKKGGKGSKSDGPTDVFDNGSFITSDKGTAEFIKQQYDAVNDLQREMVKEAEKAEKDIEAARKKSSQQQIAIKNLWAKDAADAEIAVVDAAQSAAQQQYDLGVISYQQLLAQEEQFEQQRNAIRLQALNDRLAQLQLDPERDPVAIAQAQIAIEELERQHQARMGQIRGQAVLEQKAPMMAIIQSVEQGMTQLAGTMLTNWKNVGTALRSVLANIGQTIIHETIIKPQIAKITAWAKEKGLTLASIGAKAADAGAGAASSQASIPIIGPVLAVAAMAAIFAAVSGMSSKVPSAARGFDIPSGMNPLTQLHEQEMVLPAKQANVIRDLADGKGGDGRRQVINNVTNKVEMTVVTNDADSFRASEDQISADMHRKMADLQRGV